MTTRTLERQVRLTNAIVGKRIKAERTARGYTLRDFADIMRQNTGDRSWSKNRQSEIELGRRPVRYIELVQIAWALGMARDELLSRIDSDIPGYTKWLSEQTRNGSPPGPSLTHTRPLPTGNRRLDPSVGLAVGAAVAVRRDTLDERHVDAKKSPADPKANGAPPSQRIRGVVCPVDAPAPSHRIAERSGPPGNRTLFRWLRITP